MKIHIVQKGDTLWELSKQYGVNFEELKQVNSQLASPDMIMPGMKIKIPSTSKAVKKEAIKETPITKQKETKKPYKDISPKPMPVIEDHDKEKQKVVKPQMPVQPPQLPVQPIVQMPMLEQDFEFNFTQMPSYPTPKEEPKKQEVKEEVKEEVKHPVQQPVPKQAPIQQPIQQPVPKQAPIQQPIQQHAPQYHPMPQPMYQPMPPMIPCCYVVQPCHHPPLPYSATMPPEAMMPAHPFPHQPVADDCGCGSSQSSGFNMPMNYPSQDYMAQPHQPPLNMEQQPMQGQMYPPQFHGVDPTFDYPTPPTFPDFSGLHQREAEDEEENE